MDHYENDMCVIKHIVGKLPVCTLLVDADLKEIGREYKTATADEIKESERSATECQMAMGYILGFDWACFSKLIEDLKNNV